MQLNRLKHTDSGLFFLLAGPCVIEGEEMALRIAERIVEITDRFADTPTSSRVRTGRQHPIAGRFVYGNRGRKGVENPPEGGRNVRYPDGNRHPRCP